MIVELRKFKARHGGQAAWFNYPDLELEQGQCVVLMGKTGCGKTTLLNALFQYSFPGEVDYEKAEILGVDWRDRGKNSYGLVSYMPQYAQSGLNPSLTVGEQIDLVRRCCFHPVENPYAYFEELGLKKDITERYPFEISGGMKQRVALLLGFIKKPALFVLDEPSSALDYITLVKTVNFLKRRKEESCAILMVSHHSGFAAGIADKVKVLREG
ncbi:ATP-binding cassette domain-containing protein [Pelotomaculum propionicicum]|uniref:Glutamine transport ATP-binding protein GlnQ n=1 Tax=Pelotomaculum propionicicum TaxID=258475 RepID=A0A4Y7RQN5_9FIRM|nr:ATP-binding cassette domain-containing protein [Pelotomaculum propionicicum]TEB10982.1 Glutamine transport ATP-binding protein GlnQ [Pelotomaculum propionicicum]